MRDLLHANGRRIFFFGALGGLLFGYDTGVISGAILFIKTDFALSAFWQGAVVAVLLLGAMVGAVLAGPLSEPFGRKKMIVVAGVTFTVGAILAAAAPNVGVLWRPASSSAWRWVRLRCWCRCTCLRSRRPRSAAPFPR